jgi:hypothetical protein
LDALVEELWGDNVPTSAKVTVQSLVYRLRRALVREASGVGLRAKVPGYVLEAKREQVDIYRFKTAGLPPAFGRLQAASGGERERTARDRDGRSKTPPPHPFGTQTAQRTVSPPIGPTTSSTATPASSGAPRRSLGRGPSLDPEAPAALRAQRSPQESGCALTD